MSSFKTKGAEDSEKRLNKKQVSVPKVESVSDRSYVIREGDSLWKIARLFNVDVELLKKHNRLTSDAIRPGVVLKIP